jgi:4-amino-4-deoxy-L-arabinose transferase-like glycosyltransferase
VGGLCVVLALAAFLRFWRLGSAPGWEWDEPNYAGIATNLGRHGQLAIKHDVLSQSSTYFFHPPFYFVLLAGWFKLVGYGITEARVLTALASLLLLALCYLLFRRRIGTLALLPVLAIACDGWLVFSDRVSWIDHVMLVIGVGGLLVYERARDGGGLGTYAAAGALLGAAAVFKHLGVYFVIAAALHWLLAGGWRRGHALLLGAAAAVIVTYVAAMLALFGDEYWDATTVQFRRASGTGSGAGASVGGAADIGPLLHQYRLFYATIAIAVAGGVILAVRLGSMVVKRTRAPAAELGVTFSWLLAAVVFFGALLMRRHARRVPRCGRRDLRAAHR